ncbi:hypothetical protein ACMD2_17791, partial [Ananas comosus]
HPHLLPPRRDRLRNCGRHLVSLRQNLSSLISAKTAAALSAASIIFHSSDPPTPSASATAPSRTDQIPPPPAPRRARRPRRPRPDAASIGSGAAPPRPLRPRPPPPLPSQVFEFADAHAGRVQLELSRTRFLRYQQLTNGSKLMLIASQVLHQGVNFFWRIEYLMF